MIGPRESLGVDAQITFLPTADLETSRHFYEGVLGLELVLDQGSCHIYRVTDTAYVGLCEHLDPPVGRSVVFTIVTDDVEAWCDAIVANGGTIATGPAHNDRYGITHAFILDPDGHHVEIQRFDDPDWASRRP